MASTEKPLWKALARAISGQQSHLNSYGDVEIIRLA
jgi:hypothetical protein